MVITMNWHNKYHMPDVFLAWFETEQEFIDAMFVLIIMANYGQWVEPENLLTCEDWAPTGDHRSVTE